MKPYEILSVAAASGRRLLFSASRIWVGAMVLWLLGAAPLMAQTQGRVSLSSATLIFGAETTDTTLVKRGSNEIYTGARLAGTGFTAELWFGPLASRECDLQAVPGGRTTFKTGLSAGQVVDVLNLALPGFTVGTRARLQLRVWDNQAGTVTSWAQAVAAGKVLHGSSSPFDSAPLGSTGVIGAVTVPTLTGLERFNIHQGDTRFLPPSFTREPTSRTECLGGTAMFLSAATGEPPLTFQWFKNGQTMAGETNAFLFFRPALSDDNTSYFVEVVNAICKTRSATAVLQVDTNASFFASFDAGLPGGGTTNFGNTHWHRGGGVDGTGALGLVGADNNLTGWFSIQPLLAVPVQQFVSTFKSLILSASPTPAEGFSFNMSPNSPGTVPLPVGDEGQTDGLSVVFDTFNTGGVNPAEAPAIDIKWKGATIAHQLVPLIQNRYVDVGILMAPDGAVTVVYDGNIVHRSIPIPGFQPFRAFFNLGARTGSANLTRFNVDDLCILARPNSLPTISNPGNRTINEDTTTGALSFKVDDAETPAASLQVFVDSNNPLLFPPANLVLGGADSARTITCTPALNLSGTATIFLTVVDLQGAKTSTSFVVNVTAINDRPSISSIPDQFMDEDTVRSGIPFSVSDVETAAAQLSISITSSNAALLPASAITLGGAGTNRTLTLSPLRDAFGTSLVTVTVSDPGIESFASEQFLVTVRPVNDAPQMKSLPDLITAEDTPTPAVAFTVNDVDSPISSVILSATSSNLTLLPLNRIVFGGVPGTPTITLLPASNQVGQSLVTVFASDGIGSNQQSFLFTVTNVNDRPTISDIPNQTILEDGVAGPIAFTIGDIDTPLSSLTLSVITTNSALIPASGIVFGGTGGNRSITLTPLPERSGTSFITVTVSDGLLSASDSFLFTVISSNDPPTITAIADRSIAEDSNTGPIPFVIGDVETPAGQLALSVTSSNLVLVPLGNIILGGANSNRTVTVTPASGLSGSSLITVRVNDGLASAVESFLVTVNPINDPPSIVPIADQFMFEDTVLGPLALTLSDPETPAAQLSIGVTSSNLTLFPQGSIILGGSGTNRTLTLAPATNQFGVSEITVKVSDGLLSTLETFLVTVRSQNDLPVIGAFQDVTIFQDEVAGPIAFTIGDVETPAAQLFVNAFSSDTNVLASAGIVFGGSGSNRNLTLTPVPGRTGSSLVTVFVSDAGEGSTSAQFTLNVIERPCVLSTQGTNFWLTFPGNFGPDPVNPTLLALAVGGVPSTPVRVSIPGLGFIQNGLIPADGVLRVRLPAEAELGDANDLVGDLGIRVMAASPVSVTAFHEQDFSQDAFGAIPVDVLGRRYLIMAFGSLSDVGPGSSGSQLAIVAAQNDTHVTITPKVEVAGHPAGVAFKILLNQGQTYQLRCDQIGRFDLSGSSIDSDKPVAVFAGHQCAVAPVAGSFFCNYLNEPVLPLSSAGTEFLVAPFLTRQSDTLRALGTTDGTRVFSNGVVVAQINRGQVFDMISSGPVRLTSSNPIHLAQVAHSAFFDFVEKADPTFIVIPPVTRYLNDYTVYAEANGMESYLNVMTAVGGRSLIRLDGQLLTLGTGGNPGFSFARVPLSPGAHRVTGVGAFAAVVYGFDLWDAYGYCAGLALDDTRGPDVVVPPSIVLTASVDCVALVPDVPFSVFDTCTPTRVLKRSQRPLPGTALGVGTHTIVTEVVDASGNVGVGTTILSIRDRGPIALSCPGDMTVSSTTGQGAVVTFAVGAGSPCAAFIPTLCVPASGTVFPVGTTEVVCRVADPNLGTETCRFKVTVLDDQAPPVIDQVELRDGGLAFWFETIPGADYVVENLSSLGSQWKQVRVVKGTGERLIVTEPIDPKASSQFFRFRRVQP